MQFDLNRGDIVAIYGALVRERRKWAPGTLEHNQLSETIDKFENVNLLDVKD